MSSIEDYSGLCGIIPSFAHSSNRIRCKYEFGHHGPCSFEKHRSQFYCTAGSFAAPPLPEEGFRNSVLSHSRFEHNAIMINCENEVEVRKRK